MLAWSSDLDNSRPSSAGGKWFFQNIKNIDLESSSTQLNYGFSYRKDLSEDLAFSGKHMITNNLNHMQDSNTLHSSYIGLDYKDIKFGFVTNSADSSLETELSYTIFL